MTRNAGVMWMTITLGAGAAVISGGGPDTPAPVNDTAPDGAEMPWQRTVAVDGANAGVYLGDGWGLTVKQLGIEAGDTFAVDGVTYSIDVTHPNPNADLELFRVDLGPGGILADLPPVTLATAPPTLGMVGLHIGMGKVQTSQVEYDYGIETGYPWRIDGDNDKRWNWQSVSTDRFVMHNEQGDTDSFATAFARSYGYGAATENDQGSPFFVETPGGGWGLAGVVYSLSIYNIGGYERASVYRDDSTYFVDLSDYSDWLTGTTGLELQNSPEPSSVVLVLLGLVPGLLRGLFYSPPSLNACPPVEGLPAYGGLARLWRGR
ncbi:MAG: hypothetical protein K9N51_13680 [Candidatus Pacebacteria bacterium]|nr:hypothetical protein [Candidatus Paceibacterota bacterium]